jgi:hypothetical protein
MRVSSLVGPTPEQHRRVTESLVTRAQQLEEALSTDQQRLLFDSYRGAVSSKLQQVQWEANVHRTRSLLIYGSLALLLGGVVGWQLGKR